MRTDKEIQEEIKKLTELKSKVRRYTAFGDDNHVAIGTQIDVLVDRLSEDEIYRIAEEDGWSQRERDSALEAAVWLSGEQEQLADDPEGWLSIVRKS